MSKNKKNPPRGKASESNINLGSPPSQPISPQHETSVLQADFPDANASLFNQSVMFGPETDKIRSFLKSELQELGIASQNVSLIDERLEHFVQDVSKDITGSSSVKTFFQGLLRILPVSKSHKSPQRSRLGQSNRLGSSPKLINSMLQKSSSI